MAGKKGETEKRGEREGRRERGGLRHILVFILPALLPASEPP